MDDDTEKRRARISWGADGAPRSEAYDDVYFDARDGLAETRHVFHEAIGLARLWRGRERFVIGELGFGLGLSFFATAAAWAREDRPEEDRPEEDRPEEDRPEECRPEECRPEECRPEEDRPEEATLDVVSFEIAPPSADDIGRAAARWPEIADVASALLRADDAWPPPEGFSRRRVIDGPRAVSLTLAIGDARALLPEWRGSADVWFLDGFAPAKNPELWRADLLSDVAARTAAGGVAVTYTAAGWVRRNLVAAGFSVEKVPGYGRKRDMTRGRLGATAPSALSPAPRPATTENEGS